MGSVKAKIRQQVAEIDDGIVAKGAEVDERPLPRSRASIVVASPNSLRIPGIRCWGIALITDLSFEEWYLLILALSLDH